MPSLTTNLLIPIQKDINICNKIYKYNQCKCIYKIISTKNKLLIVSIHKKSGVVGREVWNLCRVQKVKLILYFLKCSFIFFVLERSFLLSTVLYNCTRMTFGEKSSKPVEAAWCEETLPLLFVRAFERAKAFPFWIYSKSRHNFVNGDRHSMLSMSSSYRACNAFRFRQQTKRSTNVAVSLSVASAKTGRTAYLPPEQRFPVTGVNGHLYTNIF